MRETILIELGGLVFKGLSRKNFEASLVRNICHRIDRFGDSDIRVVQSTVAVSPEGEEDLDEVTEKVGKIFGIATFSRAYVAEKKMEPIPFARSEYLSGDLNRVKTSKVESKHPGKSFPLKSPEISVEVGACIMKNFPHLTVDVYNPNLVVMVEMCDSGTCIHGSSISGTGGIPIGTGGRAALLISDGIDSPVAAWCTMKHGVELVPVHFASPPYTSKCAEQKVVDPPAKVSGYSGCMAPRVVPFAHVQEKIMAKCPKELFTVIMCRFMIRISEWIAVDSGCEALTTGESLGQVASQTMRAIACTEVAVNMPVLRLLIGTDETEIITISRKTDTSEISIQSSEDCCVVFTPKHSRAKLNLYFVEQAEQQLDADVLIGECISQVKLIKIGYDHSLA